MTSAVTSSSNEHARHDNFYFKKFVAWPILAPPPHYTQQYTTHPSKDPSSKHEKISKKDSIILDYKVLYMSLKPSRTRHKIAMLFVLEQYIIFEGTHLISDECRRSTINQIIKPVLLNDATQGQVLWKENTHFCYRNQNITKKYNTENFRIPCNVSDLQFTILIFFICFFLLYTLPLTPSITFYALNWYRSFVFTYSLKSYYFSSFFMTNL